MTTETHATTYPTLAAAKAEVDGCSSLTPRRRSLMGAALGAVARLAGKPMETVRLHPVDTLAVFERSTPAQLGCTPESFRNYRSGIRMVLRQLGLLATRTIMQPIDDPVWQPLSDALPPEREFVRLRGFMAYCAANSTKPGEVCKADLDAYCAMRASQTGGTKQHDQARRIADLWRRAMESVTGWPAQPLLVTRTIARSMPISSYPVTLGAQAQSYSGWLGGEEEGADGLLIRARSPRTVTVRMDSVRRILHGAVQSGCAMCDLGSLNILLSPDIYRASLRWHLARKAGVANADIAQLVATLFSVAAFIGLPDDQLTHLTRDAQRLKPPARQDVTPRLNRILDQLEDPVRQAKVLHLPQTLMREAVRLREGWVDKRGVAHPPRLIDAAFLAGVAAGIEIELLMPLRILNLTHLRLGQEIQFPLGRKAGSPIAIRIAADRVKNKMALEADLTGGSAKLVHRYVTEFRLLLAGSAGDWLFPSQKAADRPRNQQSFGRAIMDAAHSHAGIEMNPHAFRAFVASLILDASPGDMETVRCTLGHSTSHTAGIYYKRHNSRRATARVAAIVQDRRRAGAAFSAAGGETQAARKSPPAHEQPDGKGSGSIGNLRRGR